MAEITLKRTPREELEGRTLPYDYTAKGGYEFDIKRGEDGWNFDIRLNLKSETRMTGQLKARAKGQGATCTIRRPLTLTHASAN